MAGVTSVTVSDLVTGMANHKPVITSNGGGATATMAIAENSRIVTTVRANEKEAAKLAAALIRSHRILPMAAWLLPHRTDQGDRRNTQSVRLAGGITQDPFRIDGSFSSGQ